MVTPTTPTAPAGAAATTGTARDARDDWTAQAADTIDRVVVGLGDKTTRPLTLVAAGIVYGLVALAALIALAVLVSVALVRILVNYLPIDPHERAVWVSEAGVGGILTVVGLLVWRTRRPKE